MADVFLSYARGDRQVAERLADALERGGTEVWFDRRISGGTTFSDVIEAELEAARKVVVLWSAESVKSGWVRDEATAASEAGKLVPVLIDGTAPPMGFRQIQTVDLAGWARDKKAQLPAALTGALGMSVAPSVASQTATASPMAGPATRISQPICLGLGLALVLALAAWVLIGGRSQSADDIVRLSVAPLDARPGDSAATALSKGLAADLARVSLDASTQLSVLDASEDQDSADLHLTGSAETSNGILHASIRLIGKAGEGILWSQNFERQVAEAGALREEIAAQTAAVLACSQAENIDRIELAARRLFLAACDQGNQDMAAGLSNFRRVLEIEPDFLPARLRAAGVESALGGNMGGSQGAEMRRHAVSEANAILAQDPTAVQAYSILASNLEGFENWSERRRLLMLSAKKPNIGVLSRQGYEEIVVGRISDGVPYLERAVEIGPFGTIGVANLAEMYGFSGRLPEAKSLLDTMEVRNPKSLYVGTSRFEIAARVGDPAEALRLIERPYVREYYSSQSISAWRALIAARRDAAAVPAARSAALALAGNGTGTGPMAEALQDLVQLGDLDAAYSLAGKLQPTAGILNDIWWRSYMAPFRADPRFPAFITRWGQPLVWRATGKLPDYCSTETLPYDCREVFLGKT